MENDDVIGPSSFAFFKQGMADDHQAQVSKYEEESPTPNRKLPSTTRHGLGPALEADPESGVNLTSEFLQN
jgi:hypothetical protein